MEYKYDPILCMNVPVEKSKVKDADKYTEKAIELLKQGKTKNEVIFALQRMGLTPVDASQRLGKALVETGFKYNDSISSIDEAIKACDDGLTEWLVSGEDDEDGRYRSWTTRKATKEEAKREAEKMGLSNVQVRKY